MSKPLEFQRDTVKTMLRLYCKGNHHPEEELCPECRELERYAMARLDHCKFGDQKPTCEKCPVHCYKPDMRNRMIEVMRYAGPRMVFVHPIMAFRHLLAGAKSRRK
ncbi:Nitrous oxide-stimulated promoter [Desulfosporosinus acidiphilus SJ4]|uniref:Nitrous oxide-stimulated promoter n=1 Tax=Desulfosporosinus acidiphilus (strain DSM 22704 / JCM 16185 / SJ4) TaxID=646529 RepID=I4D0I1_DESAJ|nr:nitrous oxide-stimulated promoter family protein [Desulfosporosinus acidiphilus]AFM39305.1 Nitrous oxide-stimulated promoter [Desulfosporosinus acidiphilus SJ4]